MKISVVWFCCLSIVVMCLRLSVLLVMLNFDCSCVFVLIR